MNITTRFNIGQPVRYKRRESKVVEINVKFTENGVFERYGIHTHYVSWTNRFSFIDPRFLRPVSAPPPGPDTLVTRDDDRLYLPECSEYPLVWLGLEKTLDETLISNINQLEKRHGNKSSQARRQGRRAQGDRR